MSRHDDISTLTCYAFARLARAHWPVDWLLLCHSREALWISSFLLGELNKTQTACFTAVRRGRASAGDNAIDTPFAARETQFRSLSISISPCLSVSPPFSRSATITSATAWGREKRVSFIFDPARDRRRGPARRRYERSISLSRQRTMHIGVKRTDGIPRKWDHRHLSLARCRSLLSDHRRRYRWHSRFV